MLNFKISESVATVTINDASGVSTTRSVATSDLFRLFASQAKSTDIVVPPGCRQIIERDNRIAYLFITPGYKGSAPLKWEDYDIDTFGEYEEYIPKHAIAASTPDRSRFRVFPIPFPATAILVDFIKGSNPNELLFSNMWMWALRDTVTPYENLTAYRWPFTNVFGDHRVCLGSVPDRIQNIDSAAAYVRYVYNGIGNHDLDSNTRYAPGDHGLGNIKTPYQMITAIIDEQSFPVNYLSPVGNLKSSVHAALFGGGN